jgi:hypothetical protein
VDTLILFPLVAVTNGLLYPVFFRTEVRSVRAAG